MGKKLDRVGQIVSSLLLIVLTGFFSGAMGMIAYSCPWNTVGESLIGVGTIVLGGISLWLMLEEFVFMITGRQSPL